MGMEPPALKPSRRHDTSSPGECSLASSSQPPSPLSTTPPSPSCITWLGSASSPCVTFHYLVFDVPIATRQPRLRSPELFRCQPVPPLSLSVLLPVIVHFTALVYCLFVWGFFVYFKLEWHWGVFFWAHLLPQAVSRWFIRPSNHLWEPYSENPNVIQDWGSNTALLWMHYSHNVSMFYCICPYPLAAKAGICVCGSDLFACTKPFWRAGSCWFSVKTLRPLCIYIYCRCAKDHSLSVVSVGMIPWKGCRWTDISAWSVFLMDFFLICFNLVHKTTEFRLDFAVNAVVLDCTPIIPANDERI